VSTVSILIGLIVVKEGSKAYFRSGGFLACVRNGSSAEAFGGDRVVVTVVAPFLSAVRRRHSAGRPIADRLRNEPARLCVVEDVDSTADRECVIVVVNVVADLPPPQEVVVHKHRSHLVLADVNDDSLVRDPYRRPPAADQDLRLHRRRHLSSVIVKVQK